MAHDFGVISLEEVHELLNALGQEVQRPPKEFLYLFNRGGDGFPVSFDGEWFPFIGTTAGFNPPGCGRRYFRDGVTILERLRSVLRTSPYVDAGPGGRFFLSTEGVFRIDRDLTRIMVVRWAWPALE